MRAVQFFDSLQLSTNAAAGEPREGEVIVDVLQAGICETDLQLCRGYMGFQGTLGHEFVGIARSGQFKGRRVVAEINCACRNCDFCQRGQQNHCPNRTVIGILDHPGAFADSLIVPEVNLHAIPDCVDNDEAVFVEPLAAGCRIPQQLPEIADKAVTIIGDGRLGNLCAQVLKHHRCDVTVVGKHDFKLSILRQLGIRTVHLDQIGTLPRTQYVVDCTGSESGLSAALNLVSPTGVVVLKTTVAAEHSVQLAG
ncbi:MAG: alcohol dehydrogenase catalytic domain-containing protein, partial [Planctomycetaceae bacterium]|nr:alcohol dehydrogenase catalytic domain-containing protein [Planctomycetaceae bacterium]